MTLLKKSGAILTYLETALKQIRLCQHPPARFVMQSRVSTLNLAPQGQSKLAVLDKLTLLLTSNNQ